ncbi:MAG TPA: hypothetical protein VE982_04985 [Gaiellaceae bacterium]|nr:hypothetical protein [Gaiellaceae bacterium]
MCGAPTTAAVRPPSDHDQWQDVVWQLDVLLLEVDLEPPQIAAVTGLSSPPDMLTSLVES